MKVIERVKNNKTLLILFFLILLCLILMLFRLTKSYLDSKIEDEQEVDVDVTAQQTDDLKFIEGNPLSLNVNPTTLPQNGSNLVSTTHPRVELLANDASNSATYNYYVYVKITNNTFTYSDGSTPEIILSITNPSNTAVTSISGLTYVTQNGVSGFDVTNYNGLITVATNYAITSSSSTTATVQNWTFTLTYLNLNIDQSANIGKNFDINVIFSKNEIILLADIVKNSWTSNTDDSIIIKHDGTVLDGSNNVLDAEDNSYRYTGGDYDVTQTAISAGYSYVNTYYGNTTGGVIGVNCNGTNQYIGISGSSCSTKYYYLRYDSNVTQYSTYDAAASQAITDGYIVARNLNNYVCFGYDTSVSANETTCPEQNLYRIIGAFDDDNDGNYNIKLIKADYASTTEFGTNAQNGTSSSNSSYTTSQHTGYHGTISSVNGFRWYGTSTNYTNRWDNSTFRSGVLNGYYLNTYLNGNDTKWKNMIEETTYYLGGPGKTGYTSYLVKDLYNYERTAEAVYDTTTYPASIDNYIGLMYMSDYGYASKTSTWSTSTNTYVKASGNDWIYNGIDEWTITPNFGYTNTAFDVSRDGNATSGPTVNWGDAARPVLYLDSSVEVVSGTGAKTNPYYISLPS